MRQASGTGGSAPMSAAAPADVDGSVLDRVAARRTLNLLGDATALHMAGFFEQGPGFIAEMNRWTGSYLHADKARRSDDAGFAAGRLFLCHLANDDERFLAWARRLVDGVAAAVEAGGPYTPASMDLYYGLCWGANITGSERWTRAAIDAARGRVAATWSESAGGFLSPAARGSVSAVEGLAWQAPVLAWAARREPDLADYLVRTLERWLEIGFIREDGSTYHVAEFDGEHRFQRFTTYQGYSETSTWARGHAWGMHGLTAGWEATRDGRLLDAACRMSDWWIGRTREERVPFYDFDDPNAPEIPRDSCAAAIAADVLLRLARAAPAGERAQAYEAAADATLAELIRNHLSPGGVLLHGSSGNARDTVFGRASSRLPPDRAGDSRTHRFPMEEVMPYGNLFIVSALYRRLNADWSAIDIEALP